jgi:hypothetical protein
MSVAQALSTAALETPQAAAVRPVCGCSTAATTSDGFALINNAGASGQVNILNYKNSPLAFWTNSTERLRIDSSGNLIQTVNTTAATLTTNQTLTFSIVDNSTLRISVRGSDGTTRTATVALT